MRAVKVSADSETKRMFESDLFEFFSRIPPWQPPVIFLPVIAWASYQSFTVGVAVLPFLGYFAIGLVCWTLMEYWLHRLMFHYEATSKFGKKLIWYSHGVHHDWPNDKLRLVFPPAISVPLAILFWNLFTWIFGETLRYPAFAGIVTGYLSYDMIHYYTHHFAPKNPMLKWLRAYHMAHHFKHEPKRYGVSSPIWDYVFGTRP